MEPRLLHNRQLNGAINHKSSGNRLRGTIARHYRIAEFFFK